MRPAARSEKFRYHRLPTYRPVPSAASSVPDGSVTDRFIPDAERLGKVEAIYETLPGWSEASTGKREYNELPEGARRYIGRIEELVTEYRREHDAAVIWVSHDSEQVKRVANRHFELADGELQEQEMEWAPWLH